MEAAKFLSVHIFKVMHDTYQSFKNTVMKHTTVQRGGLDDHSRSASYKDFRYCFHLMNTVFALLHRKY